MRRSAEFGVVAVLRAPVERVVVLVDEFAEEFGQGVAGGKRLPALERFAALVFAQAVEVGLQGGDVVAQIGIVAHQEVEAGVAAGVDHHAGRTPHGQDQRLGHEDQADLAAFGFDINRA